MLAAAGVVFLGAVACSASRRCAGASAGCRWSARTRASRPGSWSRSASSSPSSCSSRCSSSANFSVVSATQAPKPGSTQMTIQVTGHQWFWEVRYPGTTAVTANEIHIPARTRVNVVARTDGRHPLPLGARAEPQDRHDPGPRQPRAALRRPPRRLPRPVRRVLRPAARAHGAEGLRRPAGRGSAPGCATWPRRGARRPRRGAPAGEQVFLANACASCHSDPRHGGAGHRRPRPHAPGQPHDARPR